MGRRPPHCNIVTLDTPRSDPQMRSMVVIEETALDAIVAAARATPEVEVCGLLLGQGAHVTAMRSAANVSPHPARAFEIAPEVLLAAMRAARGGGPEVLGCYHSHPGGEPLPSRCDADAAAADGRLWLIVGATRAGLWRAVPAGAIAGRFEAVAWTRASAHGLHDMPALFSYGTPD